MRRRWPVASVLVGALLMASLPVAAQEASTAPTPGQTEQRDLFLDMPDTMGGFEPEISMTRGAEHFADLDPDGETDSQTRAELEQLLDTVGADLEDMTSGYALVSQEDFFAFVVAIRIEGVEPGSLLPAYLPILFEDLEDPSGSADTVGGKDVVIVSSVGSEGQVVPLVVYDEGDTVWMIQGPQVVVEITLENLPQAIQP
jgi:hypothetical protein